MQLKNLGHIAQKLTVLNTLYITKSLHDSMSYNIIFNYTEM